jgi:hypothetical protein
MKRDVKYDLFGHAFNAKYPPDTSRYGDTYCGYSNWNREVLFYEFAVQGYDVSFKYHDVTYYLIASPEACGRCRVPFDDIIERFDSANDLIENLLIDGKRLIQIVDELEEVEME